MHNCGKSDFGCKGQRGDRGPWRESAIIRLRYASHQVPIVSVSISMQRLGALNRPLTGGDAPSEFIISFKLIGILNGMLLVNIRGATAIFKIIETTGAHRLILNPMKINPYMGELVNKQRRGMQELVSILIFLAIRTC